MNVQAAVLLEKEVVVDGINVVYTTLTDNGVQTLLALNTDALGFAVGFKGAQENEVPFDFLIDEEMVRNDVDSQSDYWGDVLYGVEEQGYANLNELMLTKIWGTSSLDDGFPGWDAVLGNLRSGGVPEEKLVLLKEQANQ